MPEANQAPLANDDGGEGFATIETAPLVIDPLANDVDAESNRIVVGEINGQAVAAGDEIALPSGAVLTVRTDGTLEYDPNGAFDLADGAQAEDSFTYRALQPAEGGVGDQGALELETLDGENGFSVLASFDDNRSFGASVAGAGDINGDGVDDLVIGAPYANPPGMPYSSPGAAFVVFGRTNGFPEDDAVSSLNGATGFRVSGVNNADFTGASVSRAGDFNGDGIEDLILSAPGDSPGAAYIIFGSRTRTASDIDLQSLDSGDGLRLFAGETGFEAPYRASAAGDVNGDGFDDVIIGNPNEGDFGESFIVFGSDAPQPINSLSDFDGVNGVRIVGSDNASRSGGSVATAGDVNGDGFEDIILSGPTLFGEASGNAAAFVVYGAEDLDASISIGALDGAKGFRIESLDNPEGAEYSVAGAGDVNGDGFDDLIIGAYYAAPNGKQSGQSYVIFGNSDGFPENVALSSLDGANGFSIDGGAAYDRSGISVSGAGDVNGDGFDDIIVGAFSADVFDASGAGYLIYGKEAFPSSLAVSDMMDPTLGVALNGDFVGRAVSGAGDVNNDGFDDVIVGAPTIFNLNFIDHEAHVVFGDAVVPELGSEEATVTVTIVDAEGPPFLFDDPGFSTPTEQTVFLRFEDLLANDLSPTPEALRIVGFPNPHPVVANGFFSDGGALFTLWSDTEEVATVAEATQILYGPPPAAPNPVSGQPPIPFTGVDTFSYIAEDAGGAALQATASVTVTTAPDVVEEPADLTDVVTGTALSERIYGEFGDDSIQALDGDDIVFGFVGDDDIFGGDGFDRLDGEWGSDLLVGGAGIDYLYGDGFSAPGEPNQPLGEESMDDILYGGEGLDALFGGVGNDIFVLTAASDEEQIFDWNEGDKIAVEGASGLDDLFIGVDAGTNNVRVSLFENDGSDSMLIVSAAPIPALDAEDFDFAFDFSQLEPPLIA